MSKRFRFAFVVLEAPRSDWATSGVDVIAASLIKRLTRDAEVTVLHGGTVTDKQRTHLVPIPDVRTIEAFPITTDVVNHGMLQCSWFTRAARDILSQADMVIQFERCLEHCFRGISLVIIGSAVYSHASDVVASNAWDALVVPSTFVKTQLGVEDTQKVYVIENGVDTDLFRPITNECPHQQRSTSTEAVIRFLMPSRPEWGKGYMEAKALMNVMAQDGTRSELHCFRYNGFLQTGNFYRVLAEKFTETELVLHDWQPRSNLPQFYRAGSACLCLGEIAEGFGLTAAESLACGVPVICNPIGHLGSLVPPNFGLASLNDVRGLTGFEVREFLAQLRVNCIDKGSVYVRERYSQTRMLQEYLYLIEDLLTNS